MGLIDQPIIRLIGRSFRRAQLSLGVSPSQHVSRDGVIQGLMRQLGRRHSGQANTRREIAVIYRFRAAVRLGTPPALSP